MSPEILSFLQITAASPAPKILPSVFTVIGLVMLIIAGVVYRKKRDAYKSWISVTGTHVGYKEGQGEDGTLYASIIEFTDEHNRPVRFVSPTASSSKPRSEGDRIQVCYNPKNTSEAVIDTAFNRHPLAMILGIGGGFTTIFGPILAYLIKHAGLE